MSEKENRDSTPIRHPRANPAVQVICFLQGESPSPAGIATWTIAHFPEVVLNTEFPLFNLYTV